MLHLINSKSFYPTRRVILPAEGLQTQPGIGGRCGGIAYIAGCPYGIKCSNEITLKGRRI